MWISFNFFFFLWSLLFPVSVIHFSNIRFTDIRVLSLLGPELRWGWEFNNLNKKTLISAVLEAKNGGSSNRKVLDFQYQYQPITVNSFLDEVDSRISGDH